jgi:uncharacterized protein YjbJ (UPF0337 family)
VLPKRGIDHRKEHTMGVDDKMKNAGHEAVGRAKEWLGERADNPELADEGRAEQDEARLRKGVEHVKDAGEHAREAGEHISDAAHEVRERFHR